MKKIFVGNDLFCFKAMRFEGKTHHCQLPTRRGMMHGKATSCEKGRRHRLANGPLPARKILAHSTQGDFLCPRTTTCAEQPPPSPCALSSFPSLAAFCPPHVCQSESVVLQVLHSPPASPSIRYRDQRSFQWDIASSAQQARRTYAVASPVRGLTLSPSLPSIFV